MPVLSFYLEALLQSSFDVHSKQGMWAVNSYTFKARTLAPTVHNWKTKIYNLVFYFHIYIMSMFLGCVFILLSNCNLLFSCEVNSVHFSN